MRNGNPTREEVLASIVVNSDQLNAEDLLTGPITVTIEKVSRGNREQPIHIELVGYKGKTYRPCKTCRRVLIATFSDDPTAWIGQQMTLFCDPTVVFAGVKVGGIRISHLSGIETPKTFLLTKTRGKKAEVTILPIQTAEPLSKEDEEFITAAKEELRMADTLEILNTYGQLLKAKSKPIQDSVR